MDPAKNRSVNEMDEDVVEIDLLRLAKVLLRNACLIITVALFFGSLTYIGTKVLVAPTYRSSFTVYVNNRTTQESTTLTSSDISASRDLTSTYSAILTSRPVLEEAAEAANLDLDFDALDESTLAAMVTTETVDDTEIIEVSVTMEDREDALAYAKALAKIAPNYITKIVEGTSMQTIAEPVLATKIYGPHYRRNAVLGVLLGAFLMAAVLIVQELMDDRVKSESELEERYGIAVLGAIPDLVEARRQNGTGYGYGYGKSR